MTKPAQLSTKSRVQNGMEAVAALERDAQLMLRVREGDETSFALLLQRHRGPVVNFLHRMVQNRAISEELAQEVFLRVYRSRGTYEPTAKFTTWLFRIATHLALNAIRDGRKSKGHESLDREMRDGVVLDGIARHVADRQPSAEQELIRAGKVKEIRQAIQALPDKQRAAVLMHKYQGLDYTQIAGALRCSESAVKSLLFRAYETLRARLADVRL
jgi:RNA polymerase sigma-70 factor, ECF subfamily